MKSIAIKIISLMRWSLYKFKCLQGVDVKSQGSSLSELHTHTHTYIYIYIHTYLDYIRIKFLFCIYYKKKLYEINLNLNFQFNSIRKYVNLKIYINLNGQNLNISHIMLSCGQCGGGFFFFLEIDCGVVKVDVE